MGARHPQDLIVRMKASKYDFIVACNYLIRTGVVKKPAEAIRYIEEHNLEIDDLMEQMMTPPQIEELDEE